MRRLLSLLPLFLSSLLTGVPYQPSPLLNPQGGEIEIATHNRVLAKVDNEAITVLDVKKQLDLVFYKQYAEYASSPLMRHQFYNASWKQVLSDLVAQKLVLADAKEVKMEVKPAEARQELELYFGPNVIANLQKAGLTMDEALNMLKQDLLIKRMFLFRVNNKAMRLASPQEVRAAYGRMVESYVKKDEWAYRTISIRDHDSANGAALANQIYTELEEMRLPLDDLSGRVKTFPQYTPLSSVKLSEEYRMAEEDLSESHLAILETLEPGSYSRPAAQKSRLDNALLFRIFYLKEHKKDAPPAFSAVANKIKQELFDKAREAEMKSYFADLRKKFSVEELDWESSSFSPFSLQKRQ